MAKRSNPKDPPMDISHNPAEEVLSTKSDTQIDISTNLKGGGGGGEGSGSVSSLKHSQIANKKQILKESNRSVQDMLATMKLDSNIVVSGKLSKKGKAKSDPKEIEIQREIRMAKLMGPLSEGRAKLLDGITNPNRRVSIFPKEVGSNEGFLRSVSSPMHVTRIEIGALADFTVLSIRQDGWLLFVREGDLSVSLFDVFSENVLPIVPVSGISDAEILSGHFFGEPSMGNFEIFLLMVGHVPELSCVVFHLPRGGNSWRLMWLSSYIPKMATGPLLVGHVLIFVLDGSIMCTIDMEGRTVFSPLEGFQYMNLLSCLIRGAEHELYVVQVPVGAPGILSLHAKVVRLEEGTDGWLAPLVSLLGQTHGGWFINHGDIGVKISEGHGFHLNIHNDFHYYIRRPGAWRGVQHHPGCTCKGGFIIVG